MRVLLVVVVWLFGVGLGFAEPRLAAVSMERVDETNEVVTIDGSRIEVRFADASLLPIRARLLEWVGYSAQAVHHYYGRFPVERVALSLIADSGAGVRNGRQFSGKLPRLRVTVGNQSSIEQLRDDWVMVHEMIHLALADLPQFNRWLEEGLAVYVESIARAQLGHVSEDFVWRGFLQGMPHGMPKAGDQGLDHTPTWGRTYWGGALFCLVADIEIRKRTDNRYSLRDALRAIVKAGYTTNMNSLVGPILEVGDAAVGANVLVSMYQKMSDNPETPSLDELWKTLGVSLIGRAVVYDDGAPLAHIRRAMLKLPSKT